MTVKREREGLLKEWWREEEEGKREGGRLGGREERRKNGGEMRNKGIDYDRENGRGRRGWIV